MIATLALLLVMAQAQTPARDTPPVAATGTATVAGVVVSTDTQPRPLRRARVTLNGPAIPFGRTAITADDGSFAFDRLPAGRFTIAAAKDAYVPMSYGAARTGRPGTGVQVDAGQTVRLTLSLPRGAVITGTVVDVDGLPAAGITVSVLAHRYLGSSGETRYLAVGTPGSALSDDRGVYRIFGLPAGDYIVAAQPQRQAGLPNSELRAMVRGVASESPQQMTQVFYPGATDAAGTSWVTVRAGEERGGIDIPLQYVPVARIAGVVQSGPGRSAPTLIMVRTDEVPGFDQIRGARADADSRFTFPSVPPGQYRVISQTQPSAGMPSLPAEVAFADVTVAGEDVTNVILSPQPSFALSGRIVFDGDLPAPPLPALRLSLPLSLTIGNAVLTVPNVQVESDMRFKVDGLIPAVYRITSNRGSRMPIGPWWLKSLVVNGRDILDAPLNLRQGADDAVVTFTDRVSEIAGNVTDAHGAPAAEAYALAFSTDRTTWFFNSRRIAAVPASRGGQFSIRNLPPGEYRIIALTDLEQGEWFDPLVLERLLPAASPLTIAGPDRQTVNLTIR